MNKGRINDLIQINKCEIEKLFRKYNNSIQVLDFSSMQEGMSNTGYQVVTDSNQFLLTLCHIYVE